MSYRKVKVERYECRCENENCASKGAPWITNELKVPSVCSICKSRGFTKKRKKESANKVAQN